MPFLLGHLSNLLKKGLCFSSASSSSITTSPKSDPQELPSSASESHLKNTSNSAPSVPVKAVHDSHIVDAPLCNYTRSKSSSSTSNYTPNLKALQEEPPTLSSTSSAVDGSNTHESSAGDSRSSEKNSTNDSGSGTFKTKGKLQWSTEMSTTSDVVGSAPDDDEEVGPAVAQCKFVESQSKNNVKESEQSGNDDNQRRSIAITRLVNGAELSPTNEEHLEKLKTAACLSHQLQSTHLHNGAVNRRWLILMEPVNALHIDVILGAKGRIFRTDDSFAHILGYDCTNRLFGTEIHRLIPSLDIGAESDGKIQLCCGTTVKRNGVPLSIVVSAERDERDGSALSYDVKIRSLTSINGVVTVTESGLMYSFNENFVHELIGRELNSEKSVVMITDLIPSFYEYLEKVQNAGLLTPSRHYSSDSTTPSRSSSFRASRLSNIASFSKNPLFRQSVEEESDAVSSSSLSCGEGPSTSSSSSPKPPYKSQKSAKEADDEEEPVDYEIGLLDETELAGMMAENQELLRRREIVAGVFHGLAKHADGSLIPVKFEISRLDMQSSPRLFAICIGFERSSDYGFSQPSGELEREESIPYASDGYVSGEGHFSDGEAKFSIGDDESTGLDFTVPLQSLQHRLSDVKLHEVSINTLEDENNEAVRGEYSQYYDTFQLIGNGAFGSVKLSARKDTGLLVVTKFVCKNKVLPESWVRSSKRNNRMVPIEVHLLETLDHSNIVKVMDVFENDRYYQLVMEKLGCGMDLFEFIDYQPKMDEALTSYIFRQIVSAVAYLHERHIVHRDIKDENVIIDGNFCCKLIDFGSAAMFGENVVFSTFCGTMEYCSPEVLAGNKYLGPQLEMWSLGILLYTLVFYENPFRTAQETVRAELDLPWDISEGLFQVVSWLLQPDPTLRATVTDIKQHWWVQQKVDARKYKFQELLRNCERAQVVPPLYVSDLQNHLKNAPSCGNLANTSMTSLESTPIQQESGVVSAR